MQAQQDNSPQAQTTPDQTTEILDLIGDGIEPEGDGSGSSQQPAVGRAEALGSSVPATSSPVPPSASAPAPTAIAEEFEIDGKKITKEALFQTYRQFPGLQRLHLEGKPFLEAMQRWGITAQHLPQLESLLIKLAQQPAGASTQPASAQAQLPAGFGEDFEQYYPEAAKYLKGIIGDYKNAAQEFQQLKEHYQSSQMRSEAQNQQTAAVQELRSLAQRIEALQSSYPMMKDGAHSKAFAQYLWDKNPDVNVLRDPEMLEGLYLRFNRDAFAQQAAAQAETSRAKQQSSVAAGFGEGAGVRGATPTVTEQQKEILDLITD